MKFLVRGRNVLLQEEISCLRKKLLVTGTNFMPQLKISCHRKKYPNYRYFGRLSSRLTHAVLGKIFGWKYWLPQGKIFNPTRPMSVLSVTSILPQNSVVSKTVILKSWYNILLSYSLYILLLSLWYCPRIMLQTRNKTKQPFYTHKIFKQR